MQRVVQVNRLLALVGTLRAEDPDVLVLEDPIGTLAAGGLTNLFLGVAIWHVNADEPAELDYNTGFKTQECMRRRPTDPPTTIRWSWGCSRG